MNSSSGTREPEVERHEDGPEPCRGEQHHEVRRMIQPEKRHPVAGPDASIAKRRCETIDAVEKLGVRPRLGFEREGALLRCESRSAGRSCGRAQHRACCGKPFLDATGRAFFMARLGCAPPP